MDSMSSNLNVYMNKSGLKHKETNSITTSDNIFTIQSSVVSNFVALTLACSSDDLEFSDFEVELEKKPVVQIQPSSVMSELAKEWNVSSNNVKINSYSALLYKTMPTAECSTNLFSEDFLLGETLGKRNNYYNDIFDEDLFRSEKKQVSPAGPINTISNDYFDFLEKCSNQSFCEIPDFEHPEEFSKEGKDGLETPTCDMESVIEANAEPQFNFNLKMPQNKRIMQDRIKSIVSESFRCKAKKDLFMMDNITPAVFEGFKCLE